MSRYSHRPIRGRALPIIGWLVWEWRLSLAEQREPCLGLTAPTHRAPELRQYPLDMSSKLALPFGGLDEAGVPHLTPDVYPAPYHPTVIAQYALAHWNAYLATGADEHRHGFMIQAHWLVAHELRVAKDAGGWPIPCPEQDWYAPGPWLSALTQGNVISVLVRAHVLTGDEVFLQAVRRAARTFELDIFDGGVSTPIGEDGIFFEEVAVYPAAHILNGFILALFGLYDYVDLTGDDPIAALVQRSHATLHTLLDAYDTGYWSRYDLLHRRLARRFYHALHITLLQALAELSGCEQCAAQAARWDGYRRSPACRLRYFVVSRGDRYRRALWRPVQRRLFDASSGVQHTGRERVSVPITAFPVAGGMRSVLAGIAQTMGDEWEMDYLTRHTGPDARGFVVQRFGGAGASSWQFPNIWIYVLAGWRRLVSLLQRGHPYRLILPQDGVFTGAFSAVAAKMAGVRVVCMDHGSVTLPFNPEYRAEQAKLLMAQPWPRRILTRARFALYWPSFRLLTRIAVRYSDYFLPAGDDVEETYRQHYGVHPSRMSRFPFMIDSQRFTPIDAVTRAHQRAQLGIPTDAIVVTMINRLAIEKGLDIALRGVSQALTAHSPNMRPRARLIIAGDGPLRLQVEADVRRYELDDVCTLWGEATPQDVALLLSISDIFLYTGTRGINPVSILEAMATGCAVIASTAPRLVSRYLEEGRGMTIPPGDADAVGMALALAINDLPLCRQMGRLASEYIATHHTAAALKPYLRRAMFWAPNLVERSSDYDGNSPCASQQTRADHYVDAHGLSAHTEEEGAAHV